MSISTLIPVPPDDVTASAIAPRIRSFTGVTVGIMFNAKLHASTLLSMIAEILCDRFPIKEVLPPVRTEGIYLPSPQQLKALASQADFVLLGLGDCGTCSACSIQVAAEFERLGVPTAAVCTAPFSNAAKAMAARQGMPNYELVTVQHPLSSLTQDELRERASEALPQVLLVLSGTNGADVRDLEIAALGRTSGEVQRS